jgi:hypothetical protein
MRLNKCCVVVSGKRLFQQHSQLSHHRMKAAAIDRRFFGQAFLVLGHAPSLRLKAAELRSSFRLSHAIAEFKKTNRVGCHLTQSRRAFAEEAAANW